MGIKPCFESLTQDRLVTRPKAMRAVDPTYPFYTIALSLSSVLLLLVLVSSFIRQNSNLGVAFLCFWLFFGCIFGAVDTVAWSDNFDAKLYVWCDIGISSPVYVIG